MQDYLDELSDVQRQAVTTTEGPSLVIASAGSGKTRVLTYRIAHLLTQGVPPWSILSLTFTNKAAKEMKERIAKIVGEKEASKLWMGTFHSIFSRILRNEAEKLGFVKTFTIYDTTDSKNLINQIIKELKLDPQVYKANEVLSRISSAKNNLVTHQAYSSNTQILAQDAKSRKSEISKIYTLYAQRCYKASAMDFDDLLLNTNVLFRDFPDVLEHYQKRFRYILVDEYQDTNYSQYLIVKKLATNHRNVCVVGDDAQSIYSFRGAKIENILNFRNDYQDYKLFKLEQNYRSTQTIVNAANSVIDKNQKQIKKVAYSANDVGEKVKLIQSFTDQEEGFLVASEILSIVQQSHCKYSDIAILYRTNAQSRIFEETLRKRNIPYKVYGSLSFYQRKEIKDLLAYFRLAVNPNDDEALRRIVNYPARGIGDTTMQHLTEVANQLGASLWNAIHKLPTVNSGIKGPTIKKLIDFTALVSRYQTMIYSADAYETAYAIANGSGIITDLKLDKTPEGISRLQNIEELINGIREFIDSRKEEGVEETVTLVDYLENVALLSDLDTDNPDDRDKVSVMTIHSSKGLEFNYVFLTGLEENLFPSSITTQSTDDLEEERRLFYVALTRAAKKVTISYAQTRYKWGTPNNCTPSRFINEIDQQYVESSADISNAIRGSQTETQNPFGGFKQPSSGKLFSNGRLPQKPTSTIPAAPKGNLKDILPNAVIEGIEVFHEKFGQGRVIAIEGDGANKKATVLFQTAGQKNLLLKYANLKVIS
ncbi:DNA helicase [Tenuifilaceae bacterium CYCD]|nr:DNA helicase [Tenuifilaceae bacterium CYCD]